MPDNDEYGYATLAVEPETRERLKSRKRGGENYTEVVERLLDENPADVDIDALEAKLRNAAREGALEALEGEA